MVTLADLGVVGPDGYTLNGDASKRDTIPQVDPSLEHTTISQLAKSVADYEFIIHPGDLAYADDWQGRKPYMVSPGNHEADCVEGGYKLGVCPQGQYNFTDFMNRFGTISPAAYPSSSQNSAAIANAKKARSLAVPPFWFSFDYGQVHIAMIDTETDFTNSPDGPGTTLDAGNFGSIGQQLAFLEADLASVDRGVTPWVIVAGHRPWYTAGGDGCKPCRAAFEKVLYKYGVDLAAFGHVHNLQRYAPVYNNTADPAGYNNPKAPMYVVIGGAGNIEGHSSISGRQSYNDFAYNDSFGYGTLTFHNRTHLEVKFINSVDGSVLDQSMLYKAHKDNFVSQS
ncbi:hypothetical protein L7F22_019940 [Adiantum nelumboides]|nr:hypothetical protein [Adiantum nelumboides]